MIEECIPIYPWKSLYWEDFDAGSLCYLGIGQQGTIFESKFPSPLSGKLIWAVVYRCRMKSLNEDVALFFYGYKHTDLTFDYSNPNEQAIQEEIEYLWHLRGPDFSDEAEFDLRRAPPVAHLLGVFQDTPEGVLKGPQVRHVKIDPSLSFSVLALSLTPPIPQFHWNQFDISSLKYLSCGSWGSVFRIKCLTTGQHYALKFFGYEADVPVSLPDEDLIQEEIRTLWHLRCTGDDGDLGGVAGSGAGPSRSEPFSPRRISQGRGGVVKLFGVMQDTEEGLVNNIPFNQGRQRVQRKKACVGCFYPVMVMELLGGGGLFTPFRELSLVGKLKLKGPFSERFIADTFRSFAQALDAIHARGFIHRDLKPENIMNVEFKLGSEVRIVDVGMTRPLTKDSTFCDYLEERDGQSICLGTPPYMAPELYYDRYSLRLTGAGKTTNTNTNTNTPSSSTSSSLRGPSTLTSALRPTPRFTPCPFEKSLNGVFRKVPSKDHPRELPFRTDYYVKADNPDLVLFYHPNYRRYQITNKAYLSDPGRCLAYMSSPTPSLQADQSKEWFVLRYGDWGRAPLMNLREVDFMVYTEKTDVWAAGCVLWEMFDLSRSPFEDGVICDKRRIMAGTYSPPRWIAPDSLALDLIRGMLALNPEDRLNMEQVLSHPFLNPHTVHKEVPESFQLELQRWARHKVIRKYFNQRFERDRRRREEIQAKITAKLNLSNPDLFSLSADPSSLSHSSPSPLPLLPSSVEDLRRIREAFVSHCTERTSYPLAPYQSRLQSEKKTDPPPHHPHPIPILPPISPPPPSTPVPPPSPSIAPLTSSFPLFSIRNPTEMNEPPSEHIPIVHPVHSDPDPLPNTNNSRSSSSSSSSSSFSSRSSKSTRYIIHHPAQPTPNSSLVHQTFFSSPHPISASSSFTSSSSSSFFSSATTTTTSSSSSSPLSHQSEDQLPLSPSFSLSHPPHSFPNLPSPPFSPSPSSNLSPSPSQSQAPTPASSSTSSLPSSPPSSSPESQEVTELFIDREGFSRVMVEAGFPGLAQDEVFDCLLVDGGERVEYVELMMMVMEFCLLTDSPLSARSEALFELFDIDGNGVIDQNELNAVLAFIFSSMQNPLSEAELMQHIQASEHHVNCDKDRFRELFQAIFMGTLSPSVSMEPPHHTLIRERGGGTGGGTGGGGGGEVGGGGTGREAEEGEHRKRSSREMMEDSEGFLP